MVIRILILFVLLSSASVSQAQLLTKRQKNAKKQNSIYIPEDIYDAMKELDKRTTEDFKTQIKGWKEQEAIYKSQATLGLILRHDWKLWNGSRLSYYFNQKSITNANDMTDIIIRSYHRYLNGKPLDLEKQIKERIEYWENLKGSEVDSIGTNDSTEQK